MADIAYQNLIYRPSELEHRYGPNVHLLCDPLLLTRLARLCSPDTTQPAIYELVKATYQAMIHVVLSAELPRRHVEVPTRMAASTPRGVYVGEVLEPATRAVVVDIARAGTLPSMCVYDVLNHVLDPAGVRQDHVVMSRTTDAKGAVTGVSISGSKVAGDAAGAILLIPDPMGATGGSVSAAIDLYKQPSMMPPRKIVVMNLIVTPEFLRAVQKRHPEAQVYACRLDRGMSAPKILQTVPGEHWDEESGLNDHQYIIPGGGGFGELLNNAYI